MYCLIALSAAFERLTGFRHRRSRVSHDENGSIGEWVMILVMAVGIVLFIWSVAEPLLASVLRNALSKLFR